MIAENFHKEIEYAYQVKSLGRYEVPSYHELDEYFMFFCMHFKVRPMDVITLSHEPSHVRLRDLFTGFARKPMLENGMHKFTLKAIGDLLNGRDHSTIISCVNRHKNAMEVEELYQQEFNGLMKAWRNQC